MTQFPIPFPNHQYSRDRSLLVDLQSERSRQDREPTKCCQVDLCCISLQYSGRGFGDLLVHFRSSGCFAIRSLSICRRRRRSFRYLRSGRYKKALIIVSLRSAFDLHDRGWKPTLIECSHGFKATIRRQSSREILRR